MKKRTILVAIIFLVPLVMPVAFAQETGAQAAQRGIGKWCTDRGQLCERTAPVLSAGLGAGLCLGGLALTPLTFGASLAACAGGIALTAGIGVAASEITTHSCSAAWATGKGLYDECLTGGWSGTKNYVTELKRGEADALDAGKVALDVAATAIPVFKPVKAAQAAKATGMIGKAKEFFKLPGKVVSGAKDKVTLAGTREVAKQGAKLSANSFKASTTLTGKASSSFSYLVAKTGGSRAAVFGKYAIPTYHAVGRTAKGAYNDAPTFAVTPTDEGELAPAKSGANMTVTILYPITGDTFFVGESMDFVFQVSGDSKARIQGWKLVASRDGGAPVTYDGETFDKVKQPPFRVDGLITFTKPGEYKLMVQAGAGSDVATDVIEVDVFRTRDDAADSTEDSDESTDGECADANGNGRSDCIDKSVEAFDHRPDANSEEKKKGGFALAISFLVVAAIFGTILFQMRRD